jgi:glycosyltransferase involved in cell wall biosynthesis
MIYYLTPQHPDGWGYGMNSHAAIVTNDEDWIVAIEADVMLFPGSWHEELKAMVEAHPEVDVWTAYATRTKRKSEAFFPPDLYRERNLVKLQQAAVAWYHAHRGEWSLRHQSPSGFFYAFRKSLWREIPFETRGANGQKNEHMDILFGKALRAAGKKVGLMKALVCVHYYRMHDEKAGSDHLK